MLAQSTCCDRCKINKRHTSKGTKRVIICNAESPVTMSYMWKKKRLEMFVHAKTIPAQTSAEQTVLFSLLCVLVSDARFLFFLSVMHCMHFVFPFLYFKKKMGLCISASDWRPFQHLIILSLIFFPALSIFFSFCSFFFFFLLRKGVSAFSKVWSRFCFLLETFWCFKLFTYFSRKYFCLGTRRGSRWKSFAPIWEWVRTLCVCACVCVCACQSKRIKIETIQNGAI